MIKIKIEHVHSGKIEHEHNGNVIVESNDEKFEPAISHTDHNDADSIEIKKTDNGLNALLAGATLSLAMSFLGHFICNQIDDSGLNVIVNFIVYSALCGLSFYFSYLIFKNKTAEINAIHKCFKWIGIVLVGLVILISLISFLIPIIKK